MSNLKFKTLKKLKEISKIESSLTGILMDIVYFGTSFLIMQEVSLVSFGANTVIILLLYLILHYLYSYIHLWEIGESARPIHVQIGIMPHRYVKLFFDIVFLVITAGLFPLSLVFFCMMILLQVFADLKAYPLLGLIPLAAPVFFMMYVPVVYHNQREDTTPGPEIFYPEPSLIVKKFLVWFFIPLFSIASGCCLSLFSYYFIVQMKNPDFILYMPHETHFLNVSLLIFIPFRYLIMRIAGASLVSAFSFIISIILIFTRYLTEIFKF